MLNEEPDEQARLWEIAENLHRAELTTLERSEQIAEWIAITERIETTCFNSSKPGPKGAMRAAARELGVGQMEAVRATKVASLSDEAKEAARDVAVQNCFAKPACLSTALAVWRDLMVLSTVMQRLVIGLNQIS